MEIENAPLQRILREVIEDFIELRAKVCDEIQERRLLSRLGRLMDVPNSTMHRKAKTCRLTPREVLIAIRFLNLETTKLPSRAAQRYLKEDYKRWNGNAPRNNFRLGGISDKDWSANLAYCTEHICTNLLLGYKHISMIQLEKRTGIPDTTLHRRADSNFSPEEAQVLLNSVPVVNFNWQPKSFGFLDTSLTDGGRKLVGIGRRKKQSNFTPREAE